MQMLFFDGWLPLFRTLLIGVLAYVMLVALLRVSGKRTLAKLNAFDLVVTVALGSTLATVVLNKNVPLLEGTLGMAVLVGLQFIVTWLSVRFGWLRGAVRAEPTLLLHRGRLLHDALEQQRVTENELLSAVRRAGVARLHDVEAVVLETDGSLSVVERCEEGLATSLRDVAGTDEGRGEA